MGQLTWGDIITEGGLLVGDDSQGTRAKIWFNAWLRKTYRSWAWPFLKRRLSGLSLVSGAASVSFGAGAGGVTQEISRVFEPIYVYTSDFKTRARADIMELLDEDIMYDESSRDPAANIGMPRRFKMRADTTLWGKWSLITFPIPDRNYLLAFDYQVVPANLVLDADTILYPEDRTLMQAAKCAVLDYADGPAAGTTQSELQVLSTMIMDDRINYGDAAGDGEYWSLDGSVFGNNTMGGGSSAGNSGIRW